MSRIATNRIVITVCDKMAKMASLSMNVNQVSVYYEDEGE